MLCDSIGITCANRQSKEGSSQDHPTIDHPDKAADYSSQDWQKIEGETASEAQHRLLATKLKLVWKVDRRYRFNRCEEASSARAITICLSIGVMMLKTYNYNLWLWQQQSPFPVSPYPLSSPAAIPNHLSAFYSYIHSCCSNLRRRPAYLSYSYSLTRLYCSAFAVSGNLAM